MLAPSLRRVFRPLLRLVLGCLLAGLLAPAAPLLPSTPVEAAPVAAPVSAPAQSAPVPQFAPAPTSSSITSAQAGLQSVQPATWVENAEFIADTTSLDAATNSINASFSVGVTALSSGTYPPNSDFATGDLAGWTPSDTSLVQVVSDDNNIAGPHLLLDASFQSATSSAFVVPTATQSLHFKYITWNNAGSTVPSAVHVDVLTGAAFDTGTVLGAVGGTLNDGWKDGVLDLQAYRGQTIKLRVLSDTTGWTISHARVDSLALYADAPVWTPSDAQLVHIVDDANNTAGPHLLLDAAFQSATSSAFVVPTAAQSLHFKYITWNNAGSAVPSAVHVDILTGVAFDTITVLGAVGGTLNDGWKDGVLDLQAYRGQTIKLRVLSDTTGWTISHARVDTLTLARDVPGWTPSDSHAIQLSSQAAPDASGVTAPLNATFSDASALLPSTTYPTNANFSAGVTALPSSTYPTNSDFTTGDLAG